MDAPGTAARDPISVPTDAGEAPTTVTPLTAEELAYRGWFSDAFDYVTEKVSDGADVLVDKAVDAVEEYADDAVKWGLSKAGGAVGGFFGGPAGAAIGHQAGGFLGGKAVDLFRDADGVPVALDYATARAVEQVREEQVQMRAIINGAIARAIPIVVDAMYTESQARQARGDDGPADDEVLERFWGADLFPKLTESIMTNCIAPAIQEVTQHLGQFAGSREMNSIDPILVDPEVAHKYTVPVIGAIVGAVQSCVPDLYAYIQTGSAPAVPRDATISWDDLLSGSRLFDNDRIAVLELTPAADPSTTEFTLELPPHKSAWKGVQLIDETGAAVLELTADGVDRSESGTVASTALLSPGCTLGLLKADATGLRRLAYRLPTQDLAQLTGQRVHLYWYAG